MIIRSGKNKTEICLWCNKKNRKDSAGMIAFSEKFIHDTCLDELFLSVKKLKDLDTSIALLFKHIRYIERMFGELLIKLKKKFKIYIKGEEFLRRIE